MLVTGRHLCHPKSLEKTVSHACIYGIDIVQLREKDLPAAELLQLALRLKTVTRKCGCSLVINDRLDITLLAEADGLHSPADGMPAEYINKINRCLISGKSTHSLNDALRAEQDGYDYIVLGPVFRTASKINYGPPLGLKKLEEICGQVKLPVFAIGGMTPDRAGKCIRAGATGVAVKGGILRSKNAAEAVRQFRKSLDSAIV